MIERLKMKVSEVKKLNVSYTIHLSVINILAHIQAFIYANLILNM